MKRAKLGEGALAKAPARLPPTPSHRTRPTGTIAFLIGLRHDRVEPDIALFKYKLSPAAAC